MFPLEQGAFEFVVIAAIGLMVLGPKDLPIVMRRVGQFVAKMRGMAAEFRASFDELARQSEIEELRKEVEAMRKGDLGVSSSAAPAPEPTYDYNPYDNAGAGLDNHGLSLPAESNGEAAPIMGEGVPPVAAEVPVKAPRRPRAKKGAPSTQTVAEEGAPPIALPVRKPRTKKAPAIGAADS